MKFLKVPHEFTAIDGKTVKVTENATGAFSVTVSGEEPRDVSADGLAAVFQEKFLKPIAEAFYQVATEAPDRLCIQASMLANRTEEERQVVKRKLDAVMAFYHLHERGFAARTDLGFARGGKLAWRFERRFGGKDQVADHALSASTVKRAVKAMEAGDFDALVLTPNHAAKGNRTRRLIPQVVALLNHAVRKDYLHGGDQPDEKAVYARMVAGFRDQVRLGEIPAGTPEPSRAALVRAIKNDEEAADVMRSREGADKADKKHRRSQRGLVALRPLDIVLIDHTRADFFCLRQVKGKWVAVRPWISIAVDAFSGMLWGFDIAFEAPSKATLARILKFGISEKKPELFGAKSDYPMHGIPKVILSDFAREFRSNFWLETSTLLRFEIRRCPPGRPDLKGLVETWNNKIEKAFCAGLPGRTFSSPKEKGDYQAEPEATLHLSEALQQFGRWVIDIEHNSPDRGRDNRLPIDIANEAFANPDNAPRMPKSVEELSIAMADIDFRTLQTRGIEFQGLHFDAPVVQRLLNERGPGKEYQIRVDPTSIEAIYLRDANKRMPQWHKLGCATPEKVAGLSLAEWMEKREPARHAKRAGVISDIVVNAHKDLDAERRAMQRAKSEGGRPKTGALCEPPKPAAMPSMPVQTNASMQNARTPVSREAVKRGPNALKMFNKKEG
jgi:putative transposase